jgi:hypothetical protein
MPWWSWLVIWGALVLAMLAMLGFFAWWLFRKFLKLNEDVSALFELTEALDVPDPQLAPPALALLANLKDVRSREEQRQAHRADRTWHARERRRARARAIMLVDASRVRWPDTWYLNSSEKRSKKLSSPH